jgi:hypothetical protein
MLSEVTGRVMPADVGGLIGRPGLEAVERQLEDMIDVLRAEQQRRLAGSVIRRCSTCAAAGAAHGLSPSAISQSPRCSPTSSLTTSPRSSAITAKRKRTCWASPTAAA